MIDRFRRIGCEIWSVKDAPGGKLLALDTQMDKFVRFLEGWQAETESKNTSIRVSEAMTQLARQGKWSGGPPPYGFRLNGARRPKSEAPALVIDPAQAAVIRLMVSLYLDERMGCMLIAGELNRRGVPNPAGRPWDDQKVRRILQNPIIAGLPAYGRNRPAGRGFARQNPYDLDQFILPRDEAGNLRPVAAYQIVPLERWQQLMTAMQTARTPSRDGGGTAHTMSARLRGADALLTGLVFCGHCSARLSADSAPTRSRRRDGSTAFGKRVYYICQTHAHRGRAFCDGQRTYGCRRLEQAVQSQLEALLSLLDDRELAARLQEQAREGDQEPGEAIGLAEAEAKKAERVLQGWLARMDAFLAASGESPFSEGLLLAKIGEARERAEAAQATLRELVARQEQTGTDPGQVAPGQPGLGWWDSFRAAPRAEQKALLRDLVERIDVRRDDVVIHLRVGPGAFLAGARQPDPV